MKFFIMILTYLTVFPNKALAYLDPGTGSLIIQSLIAGFLASLFTIKIYWQKIKELLSNFNKKDASPDLNDRSLTAKASEQSLSHIEADHK